MGAAQIPGNLTAGGGIYLAAGHQMVRTGPRTNESVARPWRTAFPLWLPISSVSPPNTPRTRPSSPHSRRPQTHAQHRKSTFSWSSGDVQGRRGSTVPALEGAALGAPRVRLHAREKQVTRHSKEARPESHAPSPSRRTSACASSGPRACSPYPASASEAAAYRPRR